MKGKAPKTGKMSHRAYAGGDSNVAHEAMQGDNGFKRGGKASMKAEGPFSMAHAGRKPRKSGGGVFSSASGPGEKRKPVQHY